MASTAVTTQIFVPSPENHFGVCFGDPCNSGIVRQNPWKNPYASSIIRPYVPSNNTDLIIACNDAFNQHKHNRLTFDSSGAVFITQKDALIRSLVYLDPKGLANFSEVSKCCYLATKTNVLWEIKFQQLFPNTTLISMEKCCFSPEQQFKIYFKRISDELKPYKAQFERNKVVIKNLIGPNGNDGKIAQVQKEFEELGGEAALSKYHEELRPIMNTRPTRNGHELIKANAKLSYTSHLCHGLTCDLRDLVGGGYNGTDESIKPNSQQARCQLAITQLLGSFDDQEKFEQFIQASEVAKNNVSEYNDEAIPQDTPFKDETTEGIFDSIIADFRDPVSDDFESDPITH